MASSLRFKYSLIDYSALYILLCLLIWMMWYSIVICTFTKEVFQINFLKEVMSLKHSEVPCFVLMILGVPVPVVPVPAVFLALPQRLKSLFLKSVTCLVTFSYEFWSSLFCNLLISRPSFSSARRFSSRTNIIEQNDFYDSIPISGNMHIRN